jgi:hypothetical protein
MSGHTSRRWKRIATRAFVACALPGLILGLNVWTSGVAGASHAAKVAQAKKGLLVLSDLPEGWTSSNASSGNGEFPGWKQLATCIGVPVSEVNDNPPSAARDFNSPEGYFSVNDEVDDHVCAKEARESFASLSNPKTPGCLTTLLNGVDKFVID